MMNLYSENLTDLNPWETWDLGDFEIQNYFDIEALTREHLTRKRKLFTLGGDHSITYPIVKAYAENYGKLDILQIDAHPDLYQDYEGDPYSHACPFARIMEDGLAQRLVQVGIRTLNPHQESQAKTIRGRDVYNACRAAGASAPIFQTRLCFPRYRCPGPGVCTRGFPQGSRRPDAPGGSYTASAYRR